MAFVLFALAFPSITMSSKADIVPSPIPLQGKSARFDVSPDGQMLAIADRPKLIIWSLSENRELTSATIVANRVQFSSDGRHMYFSQDPKSPAPICVWNVSRTSNLTCTPLAYVQVPSNYVQIPPAPIFSTIDFLLSPNGHHILVEFGFRDSRSYTPPKTTGVIYDLTNGSTYRSYSWGWCFPPALAFTPSGTHLLSVATMSNPITVHLTDIATGTNVLWDSPSNGATQDNMAFTRDGREIFILDGYFANLINVTTGLSRSLYKQFPLRGFLGGASMALSPSDQYLAIGFRENVTVWDRVSDQTWSFVTTPDPISQLKFNSNSTLLMISTSTDLVFWPVPVPGAACCWCVFVLLSGFPVVALVHAYYMSMKLMDKNSDPAFLGLVGVTYRPTIVLFKQP